MVIKYIQVFHLQGKVFGVFFFSQVSTILTKLLVKKKSALTILMYNHNNKNVAS